MRRAALLGSLTVALAVAAPAAAAPTITEFPAGSAPTYIKPSPADGTLWIARRDIGVRQFATTGEQLATDDSFPAPGDLAVDADRTVYWATGTKQPAGFARRTPGGLTTKVADTQATSAYSILIPAAGRTPFFGGGFPTATAGCVYAPTCKGFGPVDSQLTGLAFDGANRLWAVASEASTAFRVAPDNKEAIPDLSVTLPQGTTPDRITKGPDGNLWIAGFGNSDLPSKNTANRIIKLTPQGVQTSFVLPSGRGPRDIVPGPDGALWFTESLSDSIGRITTSGAYTSFPVPTPGSRPFGITKGPDGNLWFTEQDVGRVGRLVIGADAGAGAKPLTPVKDTKKPKVGSIALSRARFRAAGSGASTSAKKRRKKAPVGTKVRFSLSEASSVKFTVQRKSTGRRSGGKCVKPKRSNRKKKRCTRYVAVRGSFTIRGVAGRNTLTFRGRMARRKLAAGGYRMTARATDPAKNASQPRQRSFIIVK